MRRFETAVINGSGIGFGRSCGIVRIVTTFGIPPTEPRGISGDSLGDEREITLNVRGLFLNVSVMQMRLTVFGLSNVGLQEPAT